MEEYSFKDFLELLLRALAAQQKEKGDISADAFFADNPEVTDMLYLLLGEHQVNANDLIVSLGSMIAGMQNSGKPRVAIEKAVAGRLRSQLNKLLPKKKKPKQQKKKQNNIKPAQAIKVFEPLCLIDGIYDLLTGKLHRLDPVIGDFGCQWRVPFVLDLYDYITVTIVAEVFEGDVGNYHNAIIEFENCPREFGSCTDLLIYLDNNKVEGTPNFNPTVQQRLSEINSWTTGLEQNCPQFFQLVTWLKVHLPNWKADEIDSFNALEYLKLCKIFTANRIRKMDCFGLSGIQVAIGLPYTKRQTGVKMIQLAGYSTDYMDYVARSACLEEGGVVNDDTGMAVISVDEPCSISSSCLNVFQTGRYMTTQNAARYETHVFYGPFRSIFMYQFYKGQPIIVDIRRLICRHESNGNPDQGTDYSYEYNGGAILYFEPDGNSGNFVYVANPSEEQINKVGMCVEAFSILNLSDGQIVSNDDPDSAFYIEDFNAYIDLITTRCNIFDLIMVAGASHAELPTNISAQVSGGDEIALANDNQVHDSIEACYEAVIPSFKFEHNIMLEWEIVDQPVPLVNVETPYWDLLIERRAFRSVADKFHLTTMEYKSYRSGTNRTQADRITSTVPFAPIHIYGCTYAIKLTELQAIEGQPDQAPQGNHLITIENCHDKAD